MEALITGMNVKPSKAAGDESKLILKVN